MLFSSRNPSATEGFRAVDEIEQGISQLGSNQIGSPLFSRWSRSTIAGTQRALRGDGDSRY